MAAIEGQMSGSADYRCGINVYWTGGQNQGGNYSTFYWECYLAMSGGSAYNNDMTCNWSVDIGGGYGSGTFKLDYANRSNTRRVLANGYTDRGHDANGYLAGWKSNAYISTGHASVGSGGSGDVWVDAPRIPKPPKQPTTPTEDVNARSATRLAFNYGWNADDGGAAVQGNNVEWYDDVTGALVWNDTNARGYTNPQDGLYGPVLTPARTYRVRVQTWNSAGHSAWSNWGYATTLSGIYVSDGSVWLPLPFNVSDGAAWASVQPKISDGATWLAPYQLDANQPQITDVDVDSPSQVRAFITLPSPVLGTQIVIKARHADGTEVEQTKATAGTNAIYTVAGLPKPGAWTITARWVATATNVGLRWSNAITVTT